MIYFPRLGEMGRLGNQMFQVMATVVHAANVGAEPAFPDWPYKGVFDVPLGWFDRAMDPRAVPLMEPHFSWCEIPARDGLALEGYFQSWRYFAGLERYVRPLFSPRSDVFPRLPRRCAIHVRRGDYLLKSDYHTNLPMAYYDRAIGYMESAVSPIGYLVSSDDMEWCRRHFQGPRFQFMSDDLEDWEALLGMASCEYQIIANSAFSWWAAFLNTSPYKSVVTPPAKRWFGPAGPKDTQDLLPPTWTEVDWA